MDEQGTSRIDEGCVRRFEAAWAAGEPVAIEDVLPAPTDPAYAATLEELVLIELELSWRRGNGPRMETYLQRFGVLRDPEVAARLAQEDTRLRERFAPDAMGGRRGRYALVEEHARGGMGVVWRADDPDLGREIAIKDLDGATDPVLRARFVAEARITAQLEHPGVVPVYDAGGLDAADPFYAMKLVHGRTLGEAIDAWHALPAGDPARPVARLRLLEAFLAVARTVAYAHARGVVHRDLKPDNIILGAYGETVVLDWGLARGSGDVGGSADDPRLTQAGAILGTPVWMSPEHASGDPDLVDAASDVWSLGAVLFAVLTGRPPFEGATTRDVLDRIASADPPRPRDVDRGAPRALDAVVARAMRRDKADRYADAGELAADVERYLADEPVVAWREPWWSRTARWGRRHRPLVASVGAALGVGVLSAVVVVVGVAIASERAASREAERIAAVRVAAEAAALSALGEIEAERFPAAAALLRGAVSQIRDEASLASLTDDLGARLSDIERLVSFESLADAAEIRAFRRDDAAAAIAAEDALAALGVFDHADWWAHLPGADLGPAARDRIRATAYHQLVLLAGLRTAAAAGDPEKCAEARDVLRLADGFRPAVVVADLFDLCGPGPDGWHPHRPRGARTATDHLLEAVGELDLDPLSPEPVAPDPVVCAKLGQAAAMDPNHAWTHLWRGRCEELTGSLAEAQRAYDHAVSLRPDDWLPYALRSAVFVQEALAKDERDEREQRGELVRVGLRDVRRALDLAPDEALAWWIAAGALQRLPYLGPDWLDAASEAIDRELAGPVGSRRRLARWLAWAEVAAGAMDLTGEAAYVVPARDRLLGRIEAARAALAEPEPPRPVRQVRRLADVDVRLLPLLNGDFELGLATHWGRGQYESFRPVWWNSKHCMSTAIVTGDHRHGGAASLWVRNPTPQEPHVFGTTAQDVRIEPGATYEVRLWIRADDLAESGTWLAVDAAWDVRPVVLPGGTYDWTEVRGRFTLDAEVAHVRIVSHAPGDVWLDDIEIVRVDP